MGRASCWIGALIAAAGCAVGPDYVRPAVAVPEVWSTTVSAVAWKPAQPRDGGPIETWWRVFDDPELDSLMWQALRANQELQAAVARVEQARALARVERAPLMPEAELGASAERFQRSLTSVGGRGSLLNNQFRIPFDLSYELDLWGRVRRGFEAARADAQASEADFRAVMLTLTADVARTYLQLRQLDAELGVLERTIALRRDELALIRERLQAGVVSELELARASTELASADAAAIEAARRRAELAHALAVLCGQPASDFRVARAPLDLVPPLIPPGVPSELLERRPDVAEAERRVAAANARIGVATAAFFPVVRLTGSAGYESAEIDDLIDAHSLVWSLGPSVSVPVFTGGRNTATLRAARAAHEEAAALYRQTVLRAFQEAEDALSGVALGVEAGLAQGRVVEGAQAAARISRERYEQGLVDYLEVVDAERSRLNAELGRVRILSQRLEAAILLVKALGGTW
ncbi:MAG TPA: efflux transporter outer membrane subunit [bacterium]